MHCLGQNDLKNSNKKNKVRQPSLAFCKMDKNKCPKPRNELLDGHCFFEKSEFAMT